MYKNRPIGIFDSGLGGLTVLKKLVDALPSENYLYFGDTARVPYGEKTKDQLYQYVIEILNWYKSKKTKAVLMACNTSSAVVLDEVKDSYDFPVFGLIQPVSYHIANSGAKNIGVIATSATVKSGAYSKNIMNHKPDINIFETGCPGLVEVVESGDCDSLKAYNLIESYIRPLLDKNIEKLILGCTHYPYLSNTINKLTGNPDLLVDPAQYLVQVVRNELADLDMLSDSEEGTRQYFVSANPEKFEEVGSKFYTDCSNVEMVDLSLLKI